MKKLQISEVKKIITKPNLLLSKEPDGDLESKWERHKNEIK